MRVDERVSQEGKTWEGWAMVVVMVGDEKRALVENVGRILEGMSVSCLNHNGAMIRTGFEEVSRRTGGTGEEIFVKRR